jgi:hypothetical protein
MSRQTTVLGLIQLLLVVSGFFGLGIVMKINGYPESMGIRWISLALFLRLHGLFFLLIPVLWVVCAGLSASREKFILSYIGWWAVGIVNSLLLALLFIYAMVFPYTRPLLGI